MNEKVRAVQQVMLNTGIREKVPCDLNADGSIGPEHKKAHEWICLVMGDPKMLAGYRLQDLAVVLQRNGFMTTIPSESTADDIKAALVAVMQVSEAAAENVVAEVAPDVQTVLTQMP